MVFNIDAGGMFLYYAFNPHYLSFSLSTQQSLCESVIYCDHNKNGFGCCQEEVALVFFLRQPERSCLLHYQLYKPIPVMFVFSIFKMLLATG